MRTVGPHSNTVQIHGTFWYSSSKQDDSVDDSHNSYWCVTLRYEGNITFRGADKFVLPETPSETQSIYAI